MRDEQQIPAGRREHLWALGASAFLLVVAIAYGALLERLQDATAGTFEAPWRRELLRRILSGLEPELIVLSLAALAFALAIRWRRKLDELAQRFVHFGGVGALTLLACAVLALLGYHYSTVVWERFGNSCWDNYCTYADRLEAWLTTGDRAARSELLGFMVSDFHSVSPVAPLLIALLKTLTGLSTLSAYRLCSALSTCAFAALTCFWLVPAQARGRSRLAVLVLMACNMATVRCFAFPQTDAFATLWITLLLCVGIAWRERPTAGRALGLVIVLASGVLVKLSFLPLLALLPLQGALDLAVALARGEGGSGKRLARLGLDLVLCVGAPLACFYAFCQGVGLMPMFWEQLRMVPTEDSTLLKHLFALGCVALGLVVAAVYGGRGLTARERMLALFVALFLLALWGSRASGYSRYYLAIVPALAVLAERGVTRLGKQLGPSVAGAFVLLCAAAGYAGLQAQILD